MTLPAPVLDDRKYADIVADARQLVPRYAPEWTDLNDSDPGIALVELFAWMTEMLIFRLNEVPDLVYVKFLELLGLTLRPAVPATADLTFVLVDPPPGTIVPVPKGTQVAAAGGDGQAPVVFETTRGLEALGAKLTAVQSFDGFSYSVVTTQNENGVAFAPFGPQARPDSALLLGFTLAGAFPQIALDLAFFVVESAPELGVQCDIPAGQIAQQAQPVWEYWDGTQWDPIGVNRDDTLALTRSGYVTLQAPGDRMRTHAVGEVPDDLYWLRLRLTRAAYEQAPQLTGVLTNTVPATQAQTVEYEVLGGSNGMPGQEFSVFYTPVVEGSLVLEIDEGFGFVKWKEVPDFLATKPDDLHYKLDAASGTITLPEDVGHIPVANAANPHANVRARTYSYGGGAGGNVGPNAITQLQSAVDGVDSVTNRRAADGGSDTETLKSAELRAAQLLESQNRAVTAIDFEAIAKSTPGTVIARAETLPLFHPAFPDVPVPGAITVVVVPDIPGATAPVPSEATLRNVCACLNQRRLLTTEVFVVGPTYRPVHVEALVRVHATADQGAVRVAVDDALTAYFSPLTGGEDGNGWPLGGTIFYSLVSKHVMEADPGVARIDELWLFLGPDRQPFCKDVPIGPRELLAAEPNTITVAYE
jgi:predicted phage baseplate assembly protein